MLKTAPCKTRIFIDNSTSSSENVSSSTTSVSDETSSLSLSTSNTDGSGWDAELVELMNSIVGETIPFVQLDESTLQWYEYTDDNGYPVIAIYDECDTNLLTNYDDVLDSAGYEFYKMFDKEEYGYEMYMYTKDNIILQYDYYPGDEDFPAGNEIYVSLLEYNGDNGDSEEGYTVAWPESLIATYFNGASVPSVPGVTNYAVIDYFSEYGMIEILCESSENIIENYTAVLEAAGFTIEYLSDFDVYSATDSTESIIVDFYVNEGEFTILIIEPVPELPKVWPEELILEYFGVSIPQPENANIYYVDDYYSFDQTIVVEIEGDETVLNAYASLLMAANYTIETATNYYYGECLRAVDPDQIVRLDLALSDKGVIIEIGYYSEEGSETPAEPVEDNREAVISDICLTIFGTTEDAYYYDEEYDCYYTLVDFGSSYDIDTIYSYIVSILPDEICYAYSEEPIVDTYNGKDEYYNAFYDEAQTVVVELVCFYYSTDYGYVAQISVYDFDYYFSE